MSQFFPVTAIAVALMIIGVLCLIVAAACVQWPRIRRALRGLALLCGALLWCLVVAGCGDTINPVRYQPVEVLVTKPCLAGRAAPAEAATLTRETCDANGNCVRTCADTRPEVCVTHAVADITELQREARQYRNLFKECSK